MVLRQSPQETRKRPRESGDVESTPKRPRIATDMEQTLQQLNPLSLPERGIVDPSLPGASVTSPMTT